MSEEIALAAGDLAYWQRRDELTAARAVIAAARLVIETWAGCGDVTPLDLDLSALAVALGDYKKTTKASTS